MTADFAAYLHADGTPRRTDHEQEDPAVPAHDEASTEPDETDPAPSLPETAARTRRPRGVERGANGRFRSAGDADDLARAVHAGPDVATGQLDMAAALNAYRQQPAPSPWPRALVAVVGIGAALVVVLAALLTWLILAGHLVL